MGIATAPLKSLPDQEQAFSDLLDRHKRHIAYVGLVIGAIGAGTWFYARSKALKEQHAATAYQGALQSVMAGNVPLAQSDLKKLIVRYGGTAGGVEGAMQLAKISYDQGRYQEGIDALKTAVDGPNYLEYDVHLLLAAGYEGLNRNSEAAKEYEDAAQAARFEADKDRAKANAARAYQVAGNRNAAISIWTDLSKATPESPVADEAKVRLGELEASPIAP